MKIGVLGGSFDPPHNGHLKMAAAAEKKLGLDLVLFVPCSSHKLKGHKPVSSAFHRSAMTALAVGGKKNWLIEPVELEKGGYSCTVDTLRHLKRKYPKSELYFIMGADSYGDFPRWKDPSGIRKLARLAVFPRKGLRAERTCPEDEIIGTKEVNISSERIRQMIGSGKDASGLMSKCVWEYIRKQSLYSVSAEV